MNFLLILAAAIIEFNIASLEGLRSARWSHDWAAWLNRLCGARAWWHGGFGAAVVIGIPLFVVGASFHLLFEMSKLLGYGASLAFLLLMLGPYDLNREVEQRRRVIEPATAADEADDAAAADPEFLALARGVPLGPATGDEQFDETRDELAALAIAADRAWFEPLFWFCVLGPVGALAYRLCASLGAASDSERTVAAALATAREALEWLPGRITVFALGVAGTLVPVLESARATGMLRWGATAELIGRSALAAIDNGRIHEVIGGDPRTYRLNLMHALVRRTLNVWLVFIAVGTLVMA